ncbi:hypothetical protein BN1182_BK_00530 [Pantoea ananatis]|nr:hypothetical protein BN1182_BK_00530 [Pantoea ananatis]
MRQRQKGTIARVRSKRRGLAVKIFSLLLSGRLSLFRATTKVE